MDTNTASQNANVENSNDSSKMSIFADHAQLAKPLLQVIDEVLLMADNPPPHLSSIVGDDEEQAWEKAFEEAFLSN